MGDTGGIRGDSPHSKEMDAGRSQGGGGSVTSHLLPRGAIVDICLRKRGA